MWKERGRDREHDVSEPDKSARAHYDETESMIEGYRFLKILARDTDIY